MNIENTAPATIAFINEKGGLGKSTLCFNAAWCLAKEYNKRILIIDLDGQRGNVTFFAGIEKPANLPTIYDVLVDKMDIRETVLGVENNLHIIPATSDVALLSPQNVKTEDLRPEIQKLSPYYDFIFIDVSPSPNISHALALAAADFILIPMFADKPSLEGCMGIIESMEMAQESYNPNLKILGFVLNRYEWRPWLSRNVLETAENIAYSLGTKVFQIKIRKDIKLSECICQNLGITSYAAKSRGAEDIRNLTNEIIEGVKKYV